MNAGQYSYQLLTPLGATQITAAPINAANVEIPALAAVPRLDPMFPANSLPGS